jgi:uncharacterized membrane protein YkvI
MLGFLDRRFFRVYIVPGAVFQSVMVGGGYGTGREIVEYFTAFGPTGGLLGILAAYLVLAAVLSLTFALSTHFEVYDYRQFFKHLLGRGWVAYEVLIILQFLLVLAVLAAAAGSILRDGFDLPYGVGLAFMLVAVGALAFHGHETIARVLTFWSFFLYAVFVAFFVAVLGADRLAGSEAAAFAAPRDGWLTSGFQYALYNLAVVPLLLYVARGFETRADALRSGVVAGAIAMLPALMFHIAFMTAPDALLAEPIPAYWMMSQLGLTGLMTAYSIMLFGTFIETGAGMLQGINDRIDGYLAEARGTRLSPRQRAAIAMFAILVSAGLSLVGITRLIASGYGTMAWGFLLVYVLPLMTVGVMRLRKR